jgi:hypothetical protein
MIPSLPINPRYQAYSCWLAARRTRARTHAFNSQTAALANTPRNPPRARSHQLPHPACTAQSSLHPPPSHLGSTLGRCDSKPSVGLVLKRSSTRGYTADYPTDIKRVATSSSPRVGRVQQVQRRCPWARAIIASPYIRQLRYGLPLCCIHGQSRGKDGAHLHNGRLARPNLRWFSAATHPTRPTPTRRSVGTVSL